jgi:hypothetical protein
MMAVMRDVRVRTQVFVELADRISAPSVPKGGASFDTLKIELRKTASFAERLLMDEFQALKLKVANMESRNYLDLSNLHVLSAADHRELGNRPPEGFVRF